jgi:hypothetical protein
MWSALSHERMGLPVFASAVILGPESRGTRDHILLSHIRDFPSLEGQVPVFITRRNRVVQLYPLSLLSLSLMLRPTVSRPVCPGMKHPSGGYDLIFISLWQLRPGFLWASSLTKGRVCLLYMLLALASVVFLGFESLSTRNPILLSHIWDFPFRRLLRLAGSRWRYSTPPPHRVTCFNPLKPILFDPAFTQGVASAPTV